MQEMLRVEELSYGTPTGRPLVKKVSFVVNDGDIAVIKGPNGIGKSTFLKIVSGNHTQLAGRVNSKFRRESMVFFPQISGGEFHVDMTIQDVLKIALGRRFDVQKIIKFGLLTESHLTRSWNTASGGEKQRTLLTRVFFQKSNILILDEPMNHLDKETRAQVKVKILEYVNSDVRGVPRSVLLVTHEAFEENEIGRGKLQTIDLGLFKFRKKSSKSSMSKIG